MGFLDVLEPAAINESNEKLCPENGQSAPLQPINSESILEDLLPKESILGVNTEDLSVGGSRWEPKQLNARHREIMRRVLEGSSYVSIAQAMGLTTQSILLVATSQIFRAELAKMEATADFDVVKRAESLSNEALDTLKVVMRNSNSETRRMQAADSLLDRAGYGKIEKRLIGVVDGEAVIRALNRQRREDFDKQQNQTAIDISPTATSEGVVISS